MDSPVSNDSVPAGSGYVKIIPILEFIPLMCSSGEFKREDLARSLLSTICQDLAQTVSLCSQLYDIKRVFVCGSFAGSHDVIREELTKYFLMRSHLTKVTSSFHYLKSFSIIYILELKVTTSN